MTRYAAIVLSSPRSYAGCKNDAGEKFLYGIQHGAGRPKKSHGLENRMEWETEVFVQINRCLAATVLFAM